ncbi:MAG: ATP-binding cassette domain-containing protein, partial [Clostridiales bacterium]|nr:ATP-binding cassette domain-containing protein [Clostridiales bacterium]
VLQDISFKVGKGESFAIAGPTGCGKTTLINLLMRYYEPDAGDILINGKSITDIPRSELRHYIGFVSQDTWLSDDTVMENIRFSGSHITEEEAVEASKKAGCDSFIRKLPKRYNEMLDNDRDDISEGQKQLLTIARAMASDPSILILDEATSSVDVVTEDRIQKAVKKLLNGRTSIIIAHRLSQITSCDKIVVIDGGRVSEIGSHDELIANGGFYSKLYASYISG